MFPFLAVGIAVGFLRWIRYPAIASILLALVAPFWMISALNDWGYAPNNNPFKMPRQDMVEALRFLEEEVPGNEALLVDYQTLLTLNYYRKADSRRRKTSSAWAFDRESLFELLEEASGAGDVEAGGKSWVMSVGWWRPPLTEIIPESMIVDFHKFGWIGLVQIRVPPELPKPESH